MSVTAAQCYNFYAFWKIPNIYEKKKKHFKIYFFTHQIIIFTRRFKSYADVTRLKHENCFFINIYLL